MADVVRTEIHRRCGRQALSHKLTSMQIIHQAVWFAMNRCMHECHTSNKVYLRLYAVRVLAGNGQFVPCLLCHNIAPKIAAREQYLYLISALFGGAYTMM